MAYSSPARGWGMKVVLAVMVGLVLLAGCETQPEAPSGDAAAKPSLIFEGFTAQGTRAGIKEWEARATTAQVYQGKRLAKAQHVVIRYFQKGLEVSQSQSDEAEISLDSHDLFAFGHVVLRSSTG